MPRKETDRSPPPGEATTEHEAALKTIEPPRLTVVGIGASAGGLEAARRLLAALPRDPGMAVVLVQHLDPNQDSMLSDILARTTQMPVHEARDGTRWEENHVYVMPPSAQIKLMDGVLRLEPRPPGLNHPVDEFFQSLASEPNVRAIGIVLSGSGTDGTKGLRAIKSSGGLTFAQDSESSKFDGMPRSAVQSGCVDFVLPPEEIARELMEVGQHPYWFDLESHRSEETTDAVDAVLAILRKVTNVDFSFYKRSTLERRILRRVALHRLDGIDPYVELLARDGVEVQALFDDVLIHVTSFFRETSLNEALRTVIFPRLLKDRSPDWPIRIWVPGCSTGEEAYSVAILLDEYLQEQTSEIPVQIFATDLSEAAIDRARSGIYPESISADVSPERLRRYFDKTDHHFQVRRRIRERCVFARQDITKDPPFSHLDLITCCNVLIYLGPVLQKRVIPLFHYALKPDGILVLGPAESIGAFSELFEPLDRKNRIYRRQAAGAHAILPPLGRTQRGRPGTRSGGQPSAADRAVADLHREADRLLLTHYAPAGVLVDENLDILHFRGKTEPFLEPPSGEAQFNLMGMVRKGLWEHVHLAVQQAKEERGPVTREGLRVRSGGETREVRLRILPVAVPPDPPRGLLVLFETVGVDAVRAEESVVPPDARGDELRRLNQELIATRHQLQSAVENHQAATEEILSANEELQSTNEEMETAKEELQSANEELMTLNDELRTRNLELSVAYSDLNNVLASANIPFLILGEDLKIRRITPMAAKVLNVIPTDVGRSLNDIRLSLEVQDLEPLLQDVLHNLVSREQEVRDAHGRRYLLRVRPYRSQDEDVTGVVMAFMDIEEARLGAERASSLAHEADVERRAGEAGRSLSAMIDGMSDAFYAADRAWRLTLVNQEGARLLERTKEKLIGKTLWEVWPEMETAGHQRELRRVMDDRVSVNLELRAHERTYRLRAHPRADGLFLYLLDVTEKRDFARLAGRANELEQSNVQLERFTYVVAHDLQEPLRTIKGYTQLLEKRLGKALGDEEPEFLGFVTGGVGRMQVLLRDLLAYSRVDLKKQPPGRVECDKLVHDVLLDLNAAVTEAGASVQHNGSGMYATL